MEPMSKTKRRIYFVLFSILFVIATPLVIFYAMGYRFDFAKGFLVTERGGIYVYSETPGTEIYVNDKLKEVTGVFNREYLSQSIKPGRYFIKAENEGYRNWQKYVEVKPQRVSSVYPFLVPNEFDFIEVPSLLEVTATTTEDNPLYVEYLGLFEEDLEVATSTDPEVIRRVFGDIQVWHEDSSLYAEWLERGSYLPSYFCENNECQNPLVFLEVNSPIVHFDFYPGRDDVILFAPESGNIFAVEIDKRPEQTLVEVYKGNNVDFRVIDRGTLLVKDGEDIYITDLIK